MKKIYKTVSKIFLSKGLGDCGEQTLVLSIVSWGYDGYQGQGFVI